MKQLKRSFSFNFDLVEQYIKKSLIVHSRPIYAFDLNNLIIRTLKSKKYSCAFFVYRNVKITLTAILLFSFGSSLFAQTSIGSWRAHVPMSSFKWIGETPNKTYAANIYGVIEYDREERSTRSLSKVNELSQTDITAFRCNAEKSVCIIGYSNGNLDAIINETEVRNQPAIMNSQAIGDKSVNDIVFDGEHIWLGTGIGVLQMDVNTLNVLEYTPIQFQELNQNIQRIFKSNNSLFMVSDEHVLRTNTTMLFSEPTFTSLDFPSTVANINQVFEFQNAVYALYKTEFFKRDTLYLLTNNQFTEHPFLMGEGVNHIEVNDDKLLVTKVTSIVEYGPDLDSLQTIFTYGEDLFVPSMAIYSAYSDDILVADNGIGGVQTTFDDQFNSDIIAITSPKPQTAQINALSIIGNDVYALPGGNEFTFIRPNLHRFRDEEWVSNELLNPQHPTFVNGNEIIEQNDQLYLAADRGGLAQIGAGLSLNKVFDESNSPINDLRDDYNYFGVADVVKDNDGNIYIAHNKDDAPIKIFTQDSIWVELTMPDLSLDLPLMGEMVLTQSGIILALVFDDGIIAYDTKNTITNTIDDEYRLLTTSPTQGDIPSNQVVSIAEDNDGEIWIGTSEGIGVIYSVENVFNPSFKVEQIIVNQDGFNGFLFETESVEAIAIDGANRKWIGTSNSGVFLVSEDGQDQLQRFTAENSPLFNDRISDIVIHPTTGEVFIATDNGLVSYRGDATNGLEALGDIKVFPNPVKSGYRGPIAISNLTEGATVRITNASGKLVFETVSNGGQAIWNGRTLNGEAVESGVYLAHITTADGSAGTTEKILVLK